MFYSDPRYQKFFLVINRNVNIKKISKTAVILLKDTEVKSFSKFITKCFNDKIEDGTLYPYNLYLREWNREEQKYEAYIKINKFTDYENPNEPFSKIKEIIIKNYGDVFFKKANFYIDIRNLKTRKANNRTMYLYFDGELEELYIRVKKFVDEVLKDAIDDNIVFLGDKFLSPSHRIVIVNKLTQKSKCISVSFPYCSSDEIGDEMYDIFNFERGVVSEKE